MGRPLTLSGVGLRRGRSGVRLGSRALRRAIRPHTLGVLALSVTLTMVVGALGVAADTTYLEPPWNGYRVYLSPAYHTATAGARGECQGQTERTMARGIAQEATIGGSASRGEYQNLVTRGYYVRIGSNGPGTNKNSSNAWGADLHIPIHSNAYGGSGRPGGCSTTSTNGTGARIIYTSSNGSVLAGHLAYTLGGATPGSPDKKCNINGSDPCTSFRCNGTGPTLTELCNTIAVAAYSEIEFHDWNLGTQFLNDEYNWAWRIGWAVDRYFGYPPDYIY